jgi:hypothetical protein
MQTTWRELILIEMTAQAESWDAVLHCTLDAAGLDASFPFGTGGEAQAKPFMLWTQTRVYFAVANCGVVECRSMPRDPCDKVEALSFD